MWKDQLLSLRSQGRGSSKGWCSSPINHIPITLHFIHNSIHISLYSQSDSFIHLHPYLFHQWILWTVSSSIHCENSNCMWWSFPWTVRPIPEDVNTVESIDRVLFFNLCLECLKRLDSSNTDAIQPVTSDKDIGHAECMQLADELTVPLPIVLDCSTLGIRQKSVFTPFSIPSLLMWFVFSLG